MNRKQRRTSIQFAVKGAWEPFQCLANEEELKTMHRFAGLTVPDNIVVNNYYVVYVYEEDRCTHLSIRRHDNSAIRDWRDLQRIKNELCGQDREGLEIYPAENRLVDVGNHYHLWVLSSGEQIPFGFHERCVGSIDKNGLKNRPFSDIPTDASLHALKSIK